MAKQTLKEKIEQNLTLFLLSAIITGFVSGIAAYKTIQDIAGLKPVTKSTSEELKRLKNLEKELVAERAYSESIKEDLSRLSSEYKNIITDKIEKQDKQLIEAISYKRIGIYYTTQFAEEAVEIEKRLLALKACVSLHVWKGERHSHSGSRVGKCIAYTPEGTVKGAVGIKKVINDLGWFALKRSNKLLGKKDLVGFEFPFLHENLGYECHHLEEDEYNRVQNKQRRMQSKLAKYVPKDWKPKPPAVSAGAAPIPDMSWIDAAVDELKQSDDPDKQKVLEELDRTSMELRNVIQKPLVKNSFTEMFRRTENKEHKRTSYPQQIQIWLMPKKVPLEDDLRTFGDDVRMFGEDVDACQ